MKKFTYKYLLFAVLCVCGMACEREGFDRDELYGTTADFQPISDVKGESGYGNVTLKWSLPDSSASLFCVQLAWDAQGKEAQQKILSRYEDSIFIDNLDSLEYTFRFTSCGHNGEREDAPELKVKVTDWEYEPTSQIIGFSCDVKDRVLFMQWQKPESRTYDRAVFLLYQHGSLLDSISSDSTAYKWTVEDMSDCELQYYAINRRGICTPKNSIHLMSLPVVEKDLSRIDYAYCADIKWEDNPDIDTLSVSYKDLDGRQREYCFGMAAGGKGYLSALPGGTVNMMVKAKSKNGYWSQTQTQSIRTPAGDVKYTFRAGNWATDASATNKLVQSINIQLGLGDNNYDPQKFETLASLEELIIRYKPIHVDEVENCVRLKTLILQMTNTANWPGTQEFLDLADHLPELQEIRVVESFKYYKELEAAFKDHPKVKFSMAK